MSKLYDDILQAIHRHVDMNNGGHEEVDAAKAIKDIAIKAQIELLEGFLPQIEEVGLYSGDIIRNTIEELQKQLEA